MEKTCIFVQLHKEKPLRHENVAAWFMYGRMVSWMASLMNASPWVGLFTIDGKCFTMRGEKSPVRD